MYPKPWVPPQYCISLSIVVPALRRPRQWEVEGTEAAEADWLDRMAKVLTCYESLSSDPQNPRRERTDSKKFSSDLHMCGHMCNNIRVTSLGLTGCVTLLVANVA